MSTVNTVSDLVVKTVFHEDVRRFKLPRASLVLLRDLISKTYEKLPSGFAIKYTDPEGDVCSIGSDAELEEAFNISGGALKLEVFPLEDVRGPTLDSSPKSLPPPEEIKETLPIKEEAPAQKDEEPSAPQKDETKAETKEDLCALLLELIQDQDIQSKLPLILQSVLATFEKGTFDLRSILADIFVAVPSVKEHQIVQKVVPILVSHGEKINAHLERAKHCLPMILPMLKDLPELLPQLLASIDFAHLKEQLENLFAGGCQAFPFDFCGQEESQESAEEDPQGAPVHTNIKCDGCGQVPITGDRYKCTVCPDFDLCSACEKKEIHPASHALLKLKEPARRDIHYGVTCDGCGMKPIEGVRYKCLDCPNFDLCSACEEKNQHPSGHTLLKLKERKHGGRGGPCGGRRGGPHGGFRGPHGGFGPFGFFFRRFGGPHGPFGAGPHGPFGAGPHGPFGAGPHGPFGAGPFGPHPHPHPHPFGHGPFGHGFGHHGPFGHHGHHGHHGFRKHPFFKLLKKFGLVGGKCHGAEDGKGKHCRRSESVGPKQGKCHGAEGGKWKHCRRSESESPKKHCRRSESESPKCRRSRSKDRSGSKSPKKCHRSGSKGRTGSKCHRRRHWQKEQKFATEFVQDVNIPDGSVVAPGTVIKQWRLKNSGAAKWPEGSKLIFLRGNRELLGEREEFEVPLAEPGQVVEIACPITVPEKAGRYSAYFQLADKDRSVFGHRFWIEFVVAEKKKETKEEVVAPITEPTDSKKVVQGLVSILPVPEPTPVPENPVTSKYASSLSVLEKMGFVNEKLNISLLERSQGNIEQVVSWLLEMEHSMPR